MASLDAPRHTIRLATRSPVAPNPSTNGMNPKLRPILVTASLLTSLALGACAIHVDLPPPRARHASAAHAHQPAAHAAQKQAKDAAMPSDKAFPYAVHRKVLPNGLQALVVPMPSDGLVAYWSIVRTGSRDEVEPGVTGFAHFFEHCMFRGTEKLPGPAYDRVVNGMGADTNAFTSDDMTAYHLSFTKESLPTVVEIEADRFQNLKYAEPEFRTESGAVYGEYRKGRTNPFEVLSESLQDAAFDVHTYKHTTIGFEADVKAMPEQFEYSKSFFQRFYRPENVVVLVAGDVEPASTFALIEQHYAGWKKGYVEPKVPAEPEHKAPRRIAVQFEGQTQPIVAVTFQGDAFQPTNRRMIAATLFGELAFGQTSDLYKKLVLQEQRVETIFPDFGLNRDAGLWGVYAIVKQLEDARAVEEEIWGAVEALRTQPVDVARLDAARSRARFGFLSNLSTPSDVCERMARLIAITGDFDSVERQFATLAEITPADVQAAASAYLTEARSTVATLYAQGSAENLVATLAQPRAARAATAASAKLAAKPVLLPVASDPNVAFRLWFKVGSQNDPIGKEGLAALTAAMLTEGGTRASSYDEILAKLYPLAARYGSNVDREMTIVTGRAHRDAVAMFYPLFTSAVLAPGFREDDFRRLRDQFVSAIENDLRFSSDEELGKATLYEQVYRGSGYAHLDIGTVQSLKSITLDDVKAFYAAHFTRDGVVMGLGGAFEPALAQRLEADLAKLPAGAAPTPAAPAPAKIEGRNAVIVDKPGNATAISFGYPIDVKRGTREYYALWIANSWLGEHRNSSSHLYQVIREERGINYGDYSYIEAYPNGGSRSMPPQGVGRRAQLFEVWLRPVPPERAVFTLRAGLREVEHLAKNGLTREQFDFTRKFLKGYCLHFAETTDEKLGYAIDDRYFGLEQSHLSTFRWMMDEITLEEVNAAVKKHLQVENLVIALVAPNAAELKEALTSDAPSPIDYGAVQKSAEILAEDREIQVYPLRIAPERVRVTPVKEMFERGTRFQW
ncbi:MAG: insulinase family protein [Planctomycetota bacterium]|nr:MAG: insulinase family protein [Planctomycetota bacterium]